MTTETIEAPATAPAAAPAPTPAAPSAAPAPSAAAPAPAAEGTATAAAPAAAPAPSPAPAPDKSAWRAAAVAEVFGEPKDDDAPEVKTEREKMAKLAGRYTTMGAALKALREAQTKISDGTLKTALPKNATPEQIAAWRTENGIPETPDKYELGLKEGTVLADADKALLDSWVTKVHGANAHPDVVKAGAAALIELRDQQAAAVLERDTADSADLSTQLVEEWGGQDFKTNIAGIKSMLGQASESVATTIMHARGPDGKAIANNPEVIRWLAGHARELGFVGATVVPTGGDVGQSLDNEIANIEKSMFKEDGTKDPAYWNSDKAQKRYSDLLEAQKRRK